MITQGQGYTVNDDFSITYDEADPSDKTRELAAAAIGRHREKASKVEDVSVSDVETALASDREVAATTTTTVKED